MKITITSDEGRETVLVLPTWIECKHLYLMAGVELVAYKYLDQPWMMKIGRCSECGVCCTGFDIADKSPELRVGKIAYDTTEGKCMHLIADGTKLVCALGLDRPWACCVCVTSAIKGCTELYEAVVER